MSICLDQRWDDHVDQMCENGFVREMDAFSKCISRGLVSVKNILQTTEISIWTTKTSVMGNMYLFDMVLFIRREIDYSVQRYFLVHRIEGTR